MTEGLSAVLARVDQIQQLVGGVTNTSVTTSSASTASAASAATSAEFADALGDATGSASGTSSDSTDSSGGMGAAVVSVAEKYLGVPYKWGGTNPATGLDCSGFSQLVYKQLGITLPRTSAAQSQVGTKVAALSQAQPGDLLFFGSPVHHVGIYVGDGRMIDAPHTGTKVKIQKVYETPSVIRRVLPSTSAVSASSFSAGSVAGGSAVSLASLLAGATGSAGTTAVSGPLAGTPYASLFQAAGQRYGLDPALLSAVAKTESGYRADATSAAGAQGLMQLMPATARSLGVDPADPAQAVDGAARLLADNLRSFHGRVDLALAAYNAGAGAVRKYNGIPPYAETQSYVTKVQTAWGALR
jgi:cell wall-associated NlpC family hydrolase